MPNYDAIDDQKLESIYEQLKDLDESLLFAGLTVVAKDTAEYIATTAQQTGGEMAFHEAYLEGINRERDFWGAMNSPLYQPLSVSGLPHGFSQGTMLGSPDLGPLHNPAIHHEWTSIPGRDLLEKFGRKFKEVICGKDGPYEKFNNGLVGQADLPITIASSILTAGLSTAAFWYPLAVYLGLLLVKTGLKTYCEPDMPISPEEKSA